MAIVGQRSLSSIARPSGAFAMLAIDQRESLRAMLAMAGGVRSVSDDEVKEFKLAVLQALTPYASGVLLDQEFAWCEALAGQVIAPGCGLIAAADRFSSSPSELIADSRIAEEVVPADVRADGGVAMKLLVLWRPDESAELRVSMVREFVAKCQAAGLLSIIEPVARPPKDGGDWDREASILAAAQELGGLGADLYKAEVPLSGEGGEAEVRLRCEMLSRSIEGPWVVLSSGVAPDRFPQAVDWACRSGAAGFLAGRAIWRGAIGRPSLRDALHYDAVPRLRKLCDVVDRVVGHVQH